MNSAVFVFALYFTAVIVLTFYSSRQLNKKAASGNFSGEFFVGGRSIGALPLAILVAAGAFSTGGFIGTPGLSGTLGPGYALILGGAVIPLNLYILGILGKKLNIVGRRTNSETYIDIFRHRFENYKPLIFMLIITILIVLTAASVAEFIGGSRVIQVMTGIPFGYSLIAFGTIITLYTALGGLRGVAIVGILQGLVMTATSLLLVFGYIGHFNGIEAIFDGLKSIDPRLMTPNFGGEFSFTELLTLWFTYGIGLMSIPWAVQPTLGYDSTKTMRYAMIIGIVFVSFWLIFISVIGGAAGGVVSPNLEVPDFNIPMLSEAILPDILVGLVSAGLAAAGQSTIAALFLLGSGSVVVNTYKVFINPEASEKKIKKASITVTVAIGVITMLLALTPPESLQVLITFSTAGSGAALISPMILGIFWPRTNKYGAFAGVLVGILSYILFSQVNLGVDFLRETSFLIAFSLSFALTIFISLVTAKPTKETISVHFGEM